MIRKHILNIEAPDTGCEHILRIVDLSVYSDLIPIECGRLDIAIPGFYQPVYIDVEPNFTLNLTGIDLGLQREEDSLIILPDGLYTIRYSISPNDSVFVEISHLRTTNIMNDYYREMCKLQLSQCEPDAVVKQKMNDLLYIFMLIEAAKAKSQVCNACVQAVDMLRYAQKLLRQYKTGKCLTCK